MSRNVSCSNCFFIHTVKDQSFTRPIFFRRLWCPSELFSIYYFRFIFKTVTTTIFLLFPPNQVMLPVRSSYQCFGEILPFPIPLHGHVTLLWFHHSLNIVKKDLIPKLSTHHLRHSSRFRLVLIQSPSQCDTRGAHCQSPNHQ